MDKYCKRCGVWKDEDDFAMKTDKRRHLVCRECNNRAIRETRDSRLTYQKRKETNGVQLRNYIDRFTIGEFVCF